MITRENIYLAFVGFIMLMTAYDVWGEHLFSRKKSKKRRRSKG